MTEPREPHSGSWQDRLAAVRMQLVTEPERAEHWITAAAALGQGAQWLPCFQAAGRAVRLAPGAVTGWTFMLTAQAHLEAPAPSVAVLTEAVRRHGDDDDLIGAVAGLLQRLPPDDPGLGALARALLDHHRALEVLRLVRHAAEPPAAPRAHPSPRSELAELGLEAALWISDDAAAAECATRLLGEAPDHRPARAALLEIASKIGDFPSAISLGMSLLDDATQPLEQLLLARALRTAQRDEEADLLLDVHTTRAGLPADLAVLADALGVEVEGRVLGLSLLAAALERGRWALALLVGDELARTTPDSSATWDRFTSHFDALRRTFAR